MTGLTDGTTYRFRVQAINSFAYWPVFEGDERGHAPHLRTRSTDDHSQRDRWRPECDRVLDSAVHGRRFATDRLRRDAVYRLPPARVDDVQLH